ncbi:MAG: thiamine pyrophosphate-binding protein [Rhizobiaceae bacterium]|nr:thiamine pyrophosphate-binding protein [Rhizobiaceae bacterium]
MSTGAQLLVECLMEQEVEMGFGVPGESYLAVLDSLHDVTNRFKFIGCRNEGGGSFMAEAYGKLTGKPGVLFVTRGPGATNASIGIHTAMQDSTPMVVFVGQIETGMRSREAFQELDYKAVFGTMAKWVVEIDDADRVPELVSRAFSTALSGRPGPVVVALPEDMLVQETDARPRGLIKAVQANASQSAAEEVMQALSQTERPVVVAGGGGWSRDGAASLTKFAEANQLPVIVTFRNQDIINNHSPSYIGEAGFALAPEIRSFLDESDLILALNVRFGETLTHGYTLFNPSNFDKKLVHIHASEQEIGKIFTPDLAVVSDPNSALAALAAHEPLAQTPWAERTKSGRSDWIKGLDVPPQPGDVDMGIIMTYLQKRLPKDTIVTNGAGNFAGWGGRYLHYGDGKRLLGPQAGAMGAGIPAAVAAKLAKPHRFVLCFAGDGDFQMTGSELGSALQYGAAPVILVLNNGTYGTIRMHQEREYPGRVSGTDIVNPDFAMFARAYGMHGETVRHTEEFEAAFERACASKSGGLVELIIDSEGISPRTTISQLRARNS